MKTIIFCVNDFWENNSTNNLINKYLELNNKQNIKYQIITKQIFKNQSLFETKDNIEIIRVKSLFVKNIFLLNLFYWFNILKHSFKAEKIVFFNPNFSLWLFTFLINPAKKIVYFDKNLFSKINNFYLNIFLKTCKNIIWFNKKTFKLPWFEAKIIKLNPFLDIENIINSNEKIILPETNFSKKIWVLVSSNFIPLDILIKSLNREVLKDDNLWIICGHISTKIPDLQIVNNEKIVILNSINFWNIKDYFQNIDYLFILDQKLTKIETFMQIILWIYFKKHIFVSDGVRYFSFLNKFWNISTFNKHSSLDISQKIVDCKKTVLNDYKKEILNNYSTKNIIYDLQKIIEY